MGYVPDSIPAQLQRDVEAFLHHEAELLDDRELSAWFELVADDVTYRIPTRTTRERTASSEFSESSFHMKEDWGSLEVRVDRMENDFAWSEDPPWRTRRHVSNVRIGDHDDDAVECADNLLVFRSREDDTEPDLISGEREQTIRRSDDGWTLASRTVHLDHTVVPTDSLTLIL